MQNQGGGPIAFGELQVGGIAKCPRCYFPFTPHLGHWMATRFKCEGCRASLSYKSNSGTTVICPCCNISRPLPKIRLLVCGGCDVTVIYQKGDISVKCSLCKHITNPPQATYVPLASRVVVFSEDEESESTEDSFDPKHSHTSSESVVDSIAHGIGKREVEEDENEAESNKKIRR